MIGIYKITNKVNGKVYIGQSVDIKKRWNRHLHTVNNPNYKGYNYPLYRAMRKYGIENFLFEVIEECGKTELDDKEIFYITQYKAIDHCYGYNQKEGEHSVINAFKLSPEDVKAIIQRLKTTLDSSRKIASDFGVGFTTIRNINVGESYRQDDEQYPIRPRLYILNKTDDGYQLKDGYKRVVNDDSKRLDIFTRQYSCPKCGNKVESKDKLCQQCLPASLNKLNRPEPLELAKMIKEIGFIKTGAKFGVSSKAIRRWCVDYGIPRLRKELISWYNEQMNIPAITKQDIPKKSCCKAVQQIDIETGNIIQIFPSTRAAARALNKRTGAHISETCNGLSNSAYGYKWQYVK